MAGKWYVALLIARSERCVQTAMRRNKPCRSMGANTKEPEKTEGSRALLRLSETL